MRNLTAFFWASSALISAAGLTSACSDDDSEPNGTAGQGAGGGKAGAGGAAASGGASGSMSGGHAGMSAGGVGDAGAAGSNPSGGWPGNAGGSGGEPETAGASGAAGAGGAGSDATRFVLALENVAPIKAYTSAGVFNTPVGDSAPGPATPGKKYQFTIDAGRKQRLSFVTMLAATNDLFYGADGDGIALYDVHGDPISGDVTSQVHLWDAGTEINEEPHVGPNTVTHQTAANTGPAENGKVVDIADASDGVAFAYPQVSDVIKVEIEYVSGTRFRVTLEDVSSDSALETSAGNFAAPISPGVWAVHNGKDPLFTVGQQDRGLGLERIAEDGNPGELGAYVSEHAGITYPASPGVWVVHELGTKALFSAARADYGKGLEHIAEDGNPSMLGGELSDLDGFVAGDVFNTPVGASSAGPVVPGSKYRIEFAARPGQALSFASMLAATNDVFFGPQDTGVALFDARGEPLSGDISSEVYLWDVGSEGNEEPGIGPNTVTNQLAPNTGTPGEGSVQLLSDVHDGYVYPRARDVLKVTLSVE